MAINNIQNGTIIDGKYIIDSKIDEGGFAKIYLCRNKITNKEYAIKILKKGDSPEVELICFKNEIDILDTLSNHNGANMYLPLLYGFSKINSDDIKNRKTIEKKFYYVTDYIQNKSILEYLLIEKKGLPEKYSKFIFRQILKGVKFIHDKGICHLDLHLKNVLFDENFDPKIVDFGLSLDKKFSDKAGYFNRRLFRGKRRAIENFENTDFNGEKVDIFCLGIMLLNITNVLFAFDHNLKELKNNDYRYIKEKKYETFWEVLGKKCEQIFKMSKELKDLYISMVAYNPEERPDIDEILNSPWMAEINKLSNEEYDKLHLEIINYLTNLKDKMDKANEIFEINKNKQQDTTGKKESSGCKEISEEDEKTYFDSSLSPKYIYKRGENAKNYIIINGDLEPAKFMNILLNQIFTQYMENCIIEENKSKLKANITFERKNENENEEENEDDDNNNDNDNEDDFNDSGKEPEYKRNEDCIICIKLFKYINGGYELHFIRKNGELEDYYKYFTKIKEIISNII